MFGPPPVVASLSSALPSADRVRVLAGCVPRLVDGLYGACSSLATLLPLLDARLPRLHALLGPGEAPAVLDAACDLETRDLTLEAREAAP